MKVLEDSSEIEKCQMKLKSKFFFSADKKPRPLLPWKAPIGKFAYEVNYVSNLRIWACYILNPHKSTVHWNGFGVGEPTSGKAAALNLKLAFANEKDDRTQGAVFVENAEGDILIGHSGDVKVGKELFWEKFTGKEINAEYADNTTEKFAYVANLSSTECLREIASFVKNVALIKKPKKTKAKKEE